MPQDLNPFADRGDTVAQLGHDIQCGRTGDKVAAFDPGAAPLGTDEEAAGTPLAPDLIARVRRYETGRLAAKPPQASVWPRWVLALLALAGGIAVWYAAA